MDLNFIKSQWTPLPQPTASFSGQTIIVTGSNVGLGLEAARHFAQLGAAQVILAVRSIAKGEAAAKSIHDSIGRIGVCEVWQLDMGNWDSIKEFVRRAEGLKRLDVVVENAGIAVIDYAEMEGLESTVAVNVVGTFLLALALLPILRRNGKQYGFVPKLVITTSGVHGHSKFTERHEDSIFEALKKNDPTYMASRYPTSKLLEVFMVRALTEHMASGPHANEPVILNCLNPGLCHSSLSRSATGGRRVIFFVFKLLMARTTEMGSRTLVAAAAAGKESHGQYMSECRVAQPSEFVRSEEGKKTQERVYTELIAILEKIQPGISKNI